MKDHLAINVGFNFIKPSDYAEVLQYDPLWYLSSSPVGKLLDKYSFGAENEGKPEDWKEAKREVVRMFEIGLLNGTILLGNRPDGFNDNDRWIPEYYGKNEKVEKDHPDIAVIHHTNTLPYAGYSYLNALGLLRLYIPVYRAGFPNYTQEQHPISSGHLYNGQQTFLGYHFLVRPDGSFIQPLKIEYTGFHAGDYRTNCRSIGIAIVDDLSNKQPSIEAMNTVADLIRRFNISPDLILGHQDVLSKGKPAADNCPGKNTWSLWKPTLLARVRNG